MSDLLRYMVSVAFVVVDNVKDGVDTLQSLLVTDDLFEVLTDENGNFEDIQFTEEVEALWNSIISAFTVTDTSALRTLSTLAVIIKDAGYTDLLYLNGNDGKISTFFNSLGE